VALAPRSPDLTRDPGLSADRTGTPNNPSRGQSCVSLDGKPRSDCVLQDLELDWDLPDHELSQALTPRGGFEHGSRGRADRPGQFGVDTVVRHIVGVSRQHGVLAIASKSSSACAWLSARATRAPRKLDLVRIATEIRAELESGAARQMAGALYSVAPGRGGPHFGARHAELQTVRNAWEMWRWSAFSPVAKSQDSTFTATPGYYRTLPTPR